MRKYLFIAGLLAILPVLNASALDAPEIKMLTPNRRSVGQTAIIHGSGFLGGGTVVIFARFGVSGNISVLADILSDRTAKFEIPNTPLSDRDPFDQSLVPVRVTVIVNGQAFSRDFIFEYRE